MHLDALKKLRYNKKLSEIVFSKQQHKRELILNIVVECSFLKTDYNSIFLLNIHGIM
jgi:hypothetical protein